MNAKLKTDYTTYVHTAPWIMKCGDILILNDLLQTMNFFKKIGYVLLWWIIYTMSKQKIKFLHFTCSETMHSSANPPSPSLMIPITLVPTAMVVTSLPISSTSPHTSKPGTNGGVNFLSYLENISCTIVTPNKYTLLEILKIYKKIK